MRKLLFLFLVIFVSLLSGLHAKVVENQSNCISLDSLVRGPKMTEVVVKRVNDVPVKVFYTLPSGWKKADKRTAVVWIHGGSWTGGSAYNFFPHARYFAARGAVGFSVEYRLLKKNRTTVGDCLADCKSVIRYIREHAAELGIDPVKIIVMGDSAGGHLASCLGTIDGFPAPSP